MTGFCAPERVAAALAAIQKECLSVYGLMERTGFSHASMTAAILKLIDAGKIEIDHKLKTGGRPVNVYRVAKPRPERRGRAMPITIPQFRWGSTRLG